MPSPRSWREYPARYRLEAARCRACGQVDYPARRVCSTCAGTELERTALSRRGTVVTSTVIHVAPADLQAEAPYAMALIETPEKARLMLQVVDCEPGDVAPGLEVELEFRKVRREGRGGILCYAYKAVPAS